MKTPASPLLHLYDSKGEGYYEYPRSELLAYVPRSARRILDIGGGSGIFGASVKRELNAECWGVEPVEKAAQHAATQLDRVLHGFFGPELDLPPASFDLICFNDVLEHLPEPVSALRLARTLLRPGGRILASLPNFRYVTNLWRLIVRNKATYVDHGIMDRTHLRIFSKTSIPPFFSDGGYDIETLEGINPTGAAFRFSVFNALTLGAIEDMRWQQYVAIARPRD